MDTAKALLGSRNRSRAGVLAAAIASVWTLLQPLPARALSTQFLLDPSLSLVAMGGDFAKYPSNTVLTLNLDFDHMVGNQVPVTFSNFFLPPVPVAFGGQYTFSVPSTFTGTLGLDGAFSSDAVPAQLGEKIGFTVAPTSNFSFTLTTGTISGPPCGQFSGGPVGSGTAFNLNTGSGSLLGVACAGSLELDTLFEIRLVGTFAPIAVPVPEPGTLLLVGSGLLGITLVSRGKPGRDTFPIARPLQNGDWYAASRVSSPPRPFSGTISKDPRGERGDRL
jgi:hypothetical protein